MYSRKSARNGFEKKRGYCSEDCSTVHTQSKVRIGLDSVAVGTRGFERSGKVILVPETEEEEAGGPYESSNSVLVLVLARDRSASHPCALTLRGEPSSTRSGRSRPSNPGRSR